MGDCIEKSKFVCVCEGGVKLILWAFSVKALLKVNPKTSCFKLVFCFCLPRGESKTSVFITSHSSQVVKSVLQYETNLGVNIFSIRLEIVIFSKDLKIQDLKRIAFQFFLHSAVLFPKNEVKRFCLMGWVAWLWT